MNCNERERVRELGVSLGLCVILYWVFGFLFDLVVVKGKVVVFLDVLILFGLVVCWWWVVLGGGCWVVYGGFGFYLGIIF